MVSKIIGRMDRNLGFFLGLSNESFGHALAVFRFATREVVLSFVFQQKDSAIRTKDESINLADF